MLVAGPVNPEKAWEAALHPYYMGYFAIELVAKVLFLLYDSNSQPYVERTNAPTAPLECDRQ